MSRWGLRALILIVTAAGFLYWVKQSRVRRLAEFPGSLHVGQTLPSQDLLLTTWRGRRLRYPLLLYPQAQVKGIIDNKDNSITLNLVTTDAFPLVKEYYTTHLQTLGKVKITESRLPSVPAATFWMGEGWTQTIVCVLPMPQGGLLISAGAELEEEP